MKISLRVNGEDVSAEVEPNELVVDFLRNQLRLTGTHVGCDTSQCGACNILLDGVCVKACSLLMPQVDGTQITTIEGLADGATLHPMQQAFHENHALQCGFCTPGMVMSGIAIANRHGTPNEATIREELEGNLCRCTGYQNIVKAIDQGARAMAITGEG